MIFFLRLWHWLYPSPKMYVDSTVIDYYHRTVERKMHWSERTDLKGKNSILYAPCR
jgi:hypothetical protein